MESVLIKKGCTRMSFTICKKYFYFHLYVVALMVVKLWWRPLVIENYPYFLEWVGLEWYG